MPNDASLTPDVTVIGGGMAGMAAAIHLATAGLRVTCIEPESAVQQPVGESLDWATPDLLAALGFSRNYLLTSHISTYKRHVTLQMSDGRSVQYIPSPWLGRPPYNIELTTLHADRLTLDQQLRERVVSLGVNVVHDRAVSVDRNGGRIASVRSANGGRYVSRWYVDASGYATSLLARQFNLPSREYGPRKVAMWEYFAVAAPSQGTTIYMEDTPGQYLEWIWEIPITVDTVGVGYVATGESVKRKRSEGLTVEQIFRLQLAKFPHFEPLLAATPGTLRVTSFACRTYKGVAGPNLIIAGEAASLVDPITSNGVSAALRHAAEAAALIVSARDRTALPLLGRSLYSLRVLQMGRFFNSGIEKLVYDWPVRDRIGMSLAGRIYTAAAWSFNGIYSRLRPRGVVATQAFGSFLSLFRMMAWACRRVCSLIGPSPGNP
jgi:menaquinone-9 beta-reductase